jgi:hypothetical protein
MFERRVHETGREPDAVNAAAIVIHCLDHLVEQPVGALVGVVRIPVPDPKCPELAGGEGVQRPGDVDDLRGVIAAESVQLGGDEEGLHAE